MIYSIGLETDLDFNGNPMVDAYKLEAALKEGVRMYGFASGEAGTLSFGPELEYRSEKFQAEGLLLGLKIKKDYESQQDVLKKVVDVLGSMSFHSGEQAAMVQDLVLRAKKVL
jgi:hypothetical protein